MKVTILIAYFIFIISLGIYSFFKVKEPRDYFIAGKRNGAWQIAGSLLATILGGSAILGTVNLTKTQGWAASWYLLAGSIGFWLLIPLVGKVNRLGKFTLTNLLGQFYGEPARKVASVIIPLAWTGIVAAQIIASAKILYSFFDLSYSSGVFLSAGVFIVYTLIGGQISIIKTDFFQAIIILLGVVLTALYLWAEPLNTIPSFSSEFPFNTGFSSVDLLILMLTFSSTFVVGPDIYSRIFCSRDEKSARKSVLISAVVLIPFAFLLAFIGVFAYHNLPASELTKSAALIDVVNYYLPNWMAGIMAAALLSAVLSSADTTLLTASMIVSELISADINNERSLKNTRYFIVAIGCVSLLIALKVTSIIGTLLLALSFYSGAFIVPLLAALTNRKVNKKLGILAMITGGLIALGGKIAVSFLGAEIGNWIIVLAFVVNGSILAIPEKTKTLTTS